MVKLGRKQKAALQRKKELAGVYLLKQREISCFHILPYGRAVTNIENQGFGDSTTWTPDEKRFFDSKISDISSSALDIDFTRIKQRKGVDAVYTSVGWSDIIMVNSAHEVSSRSESTTIWAFEYRCVRTIE